MTDSYASLSQTRKGWCLEVEHHFFWGKEAKTSSWRAKLLSDSFSLPLVSKEFKVSCNWQRFPQKSGVDFRMQPKFWTPLLQRTPKHFRLVDYIIIVLCSLVTLVTLVLIIDCWLFWWLIIHYVYLLFIFDHEVYFWLWIIYWIIYCINYHGF